MVLATWITNQVIFNGIVTGLVTGLVALGVVLVYRSTRVINFAVGNMGLPGASLLALMMINYELGFWFSLFVSMVVGMLFAAAIEFIVIRRLFEAPRVIVLVATIGVAQLAQAIIRAFPDLSRSSGARYPVALGSVYDDALGRGVRVTGAQITILIVVPILAGALGWFLNRTTFGRTVQASADNPDLARISGISPKRVSTFVWVVAGLLATVSLIMLSGLSGLPSGVENLGPTTLSRALAAAVLAGMVSFPRALGAGVLIGIVESLVRFNFLDQATMIDFLLFVAVVIAVFFQSRSTGDDLASFSFAPKVRPVPEHLRSIWWVKRMPMIVGVVAIAVAVALPFIIEEPSRHLLYTRIFLTAIAGLSLTVVTGWSGQLSLGQMAFAGLGALFAASVSRGLELDIGWKDTRIIDFELDGLPFGVAIFVAPLFTAAIAAAIGVGALRVRGLLLAVSTFTFALAAQQYLYRRPFFSDGQNTSVLFRRGDFLGISLDSQRSYYLFCLAILVVVVIITGRLRGTGIGRTTIAVRDNPDTASAYTVGNSRTKLVAFAYAGGLAGLAGALIGGAVQTVPLGERFFQVGDSLQLVAVVVIGGLGSVAGPVIGSLWVTGLPAFFEGNNVIPLLTSSLGLLVLLLYFPGGLVQIGYSTRDAIISWLDKRVEAPAASATASTPGSLTGHRARTEEASDLLPLRAENVEVRFGGNMAVNRASIEVRPNEVVGLIGTNGAGKSTLVNAIGGYVPSEGTIELFGKNMKSMSASARARGGLGRTFQAAALFPELTVRETIMVALEARGRTGFLSAAFALPPSVRSERAKLSESRDLIDFLGLGRYADAYISDLSTGTRRIVELAGLLALDARVLCLDEPTAGVAQRETEQFGPLILEIRRELGAAMVVIEHDMPLIMSISDRVYCLEAGKVIAEGLPSVVRNDPRVIASYLGTDDRAIERSDQA